MAPVISLLGTDPVNHEILTGYTDAGATASDVSDGDITANIVVTGSVDSNTLGRYILSYDVSNSAGVQAATVTRTVNVVDSTIPVITLLGDASLNHEVKTAYVDAGATAVDNNDGDISANIVVTGSVDVNTLGTYTLSFDVSDNEGNVATTKVRTVNVVDSTIPVITLLGDASLNHEVKTAYVDAGATAVDNNDGDISANIVVTGSVDVNTLGTYTLSFDVSDNEGNVATTKVRTVNVVDSTIPVITLLGDASVNVEINSSYTDAGATAVDNLDGDVSANLQVSSDVDVNTLGTYSVTYDVSDNAGNVATTVTRTVNVVDSIAPVITLAGDASLNHEIKSAYRDAGASAVDTYDGDLTSSIVVSGSVNTDVIGTYTLSYDVSDNAGNVATTVTRTVNVVDTVAPSITITGDVSLNHQVLTAYSDAGATAADDNEGDITSDIVVTNNVDANVIGTYQVHYDVSDNAGNQANRKTRTVFVVDNIAPDISLTGPSNLDIEYNSTYNDQGATASDNYDGDITANIVVTNNVNTSAVGSYSVLYNVSDAAGNAATEVTRTVNVIDVTAPTITLQGDPVVYHPQGDDYVDSGVSAIDDVDGNISSNVVVTGSVNKDVVATYTLLFDVSDNAGNEATQVSREVQVIAKHSAAISTSGLASEISEGELTNTQTHTVKLTLGGSYSSALGSTPSFTLVNGTVSSFTSVDSLNYIVEVQATSNGAVSISLADGILSDDNNSVNSVSNTFSWTYRTQYTATMTAVTVADQGTTTSEEVVYNLAFSIDNNSSIPLPTSDDFDLSNCTIESVVNGKSGGVTEYNSFVITTKATNTYASSHIKLNENRVVDPTSGGINGASSQFVFTSSPTMTAVLEAHPSAGTADGSTIASKEIKYILTLASSHASTVTSTTLNDSSLYDITNATLTSVQQGYNGNMNKFIITLDATTSYQASSLKVKNRGFFDAFTIAQNLESNTMNWTYEPVFDLTVTPLVSNASTTELIEVYYDITLVSGISYEDISADSFTITEASYDRHEILSSPDRMRVYVQTSNSYTASTFQVNVNEFTLTTSDNARSNVSSTFSWTSQPVFDITIDALTAENGADSLGPVQYRLTLDNTDVSLQNLTLDSTYFSMSNATFEGSSFVGVSGDTVVYDVSFEAINPHDSTSSFSIPAASFITSEPVEYKNNASSQFTWLDLNPPSLTFAANTGTNSIAGTKLESYSSGSVLKKHRVNSPNVSIYINVNKNNMQNLDTVSNYEVSGCSIESITVTNASENYTRATIELKVTDMDTADQISIVAKNGVFQDQFGQVNQQAKTFAFYTDVVPLTISSVDVTNGGSVVSHASNLLSLSFTSSAGTFNSLDSELTTQITNGQWSGVNYTNLTATGVDISSTNIGGDVSVTILMDVGDLIISDGSLRSEAKTFQFTFQAAKPVLTFELMNTLVDEFIVDSIATIRIHSNIARDVAENLTGSFTQSSGYTITNGVLLSQNNITSSLPYYTEFTVNLTRNSTSTIQFNAGGVSNRNGLTNDAVVMTLTGKHEDNITLSSTDVTSGESLYGNALITPTSDTTSNAIASLDFSKLTVTNGTHSDQSDNTFTVISNDSTSAVTITIDCAPGFAIHANGFSSSPTSFSFVMNSNSSTSLVRLNELGITGVNDNDIIEYKSVNFNDDANRVNGKITIPAEKLNRISNVNARKVLFQEMLTRDNIEIDEFDLDSVPFTATQLSSFSNKTNPKIIVTRPSETTINFSDYVVSNAREVVIYSPLVNNNDKQVLQLAGTSDIYTITRLNETQFSLFRRNVDLGVYTSDDVFDTGFGYILTFGSVGAQFNDDPVVPCFLENTRILTTNGYKQVQDLKAGVDKIIDYEGKTKEILEIGQFKKIYDGINFPCVIPRGSVLDKNAVCDQDLYLTHNHCIYHPGKNMFIPPMMMKIPRDQSVVDYYTYYHIYTENFFTDTIIANGIPCETHSKYIASYMKQKDPSNGFLKAVLRKCGAIKNSMRKRMTPQEFKALEQNVLKTTKSRK